MEIASGLICLKDNTPENNGEKVSTPDLRCEAGFATNEDMMMENGKWVEAPAGGRNPVKYPG